MHKFHVCFGDGSGCSEVEVPSSELDGFIKDHEDDMDVLRLIELD